MKNLNEMKARQKDFVGHLRGLTEKYVAGLEKEKIQTILLSGSVARGDYFPGEAWRICGFDCNDKRTEF